MNSRQEEVYKAALALVDVVGPPTFRIAPGELAAFKRLRRACGAAGAPSFTVKRPPTGPPALLRNDDLGEQYANAHDLDLAADLLNDHYETRGGNA